jgi:hypothetical protein
MRAATPSLTVLGVADTPRIELPIAETSLSRALRFRLSLIGLAIGFLALAAAALGSPR